MAMEEGRETNKLGCNETLLEMILHQNYQKAKKTKMLVAIHIFFIILSYRYLTITNTCGVEFHAIMMSKLTISNLKI